EEVAVRGGGRGGRCVDQEGLRGREGVGRGDQGGGEEQTQVHRDPGQVQEECPRPGHRQTGDAREHAGGGRAHRRGRRTWVVRGRDVAAGVQRCPAGRRGNRGRDREHDRRTGRVRLGR